MDRHEAAPQQQAAAMIEEVPTSRDTYALGTAVTPEGAIPEVAAGENFIRGNEIYLSVDVKSASTDQAIAVDWVGPRGEVVRHDVQQIPQAKAYATFSTGPTRQWVAGEYHAVVVIDGRRVTERIFVLS